MSSHLRKFFSVAIVPIGILAIGLAILTLVPRTRDRLRQLVVSPERLVLAKIEADLNGQGQVFEIVKIKAGQGILLEFYKKDLQTHQSDFFAKQVLEESRDGYFDLHGQAVNLSVSDIDHDGILEVITATYDENLVPRLYAFKYHHDLQTFERLGPESLKF